MHEGARRARVSSLAHQVFDGRLQSLDDFLAGYLAAAKLHGQAEGLFRRLVAEDVALRATLDAPLRLPRDAPRVAAGHALLLQALDEGHHLLVRRLSHHL